jgi:hypothetical protein
MKKIMKILAIARETFWGKTTPQEEVEPPRVPAVGFLEVCREKKEDSLRWESLQKQRSLLLDERRPLQQAVDSLDLKIRWIDIKIDSLVVELEELDRKVYPF